VDGRDDPRIESGDGDDDRNMLSSHAIQCEPTHMEFS
jgi:hypothetical protein